MTSLFSKLNLAHIVSLFLLLLLCLTLSPTVGLLSGVSSVFGYGVGLSVDSTSVLNGYAIADDSYTNGFRFRMRVTVDNPAESSLFSKFKWTGQRSVEVRRSQRQLICLLIS